MSILTEAEITASLRTLYTMRNSGVLIVRHGDTSTQFNSISEMNKAIKDLEGQLNTAQGKVRSRVSYIRQSRKGYGRNGEDC